MSSDSRPSRLRHAEQALEELARLVAPPAARQRSTYQKVQIMKAVCGSAEVVWCRVAIQPVAIAQVALRWRPAWRGTADRSRRRGRVRAAAGRSRRGRRRRARSERRRCSSFQASRKNVLAHGIRALTPVRARGPCSPRRSAIARQAVAAAQHIAAENVCTALDAAELPRAGVRAGRSTAIARSPSRSELAELAPRRRGASGARRRTTCAEASTIAP